MVPVWYQHGTFTTKWYHGTTGSFSPSARCVRPTPLRGPLVRTWRIYCFACFSSLLLNSPTATMPRRSTRERQEPRPFWQLSALKPPEDKENADSPAPLANQKTGGDGGAVKAVKATKPAKQEASKETKPTKATKATKEAKVKAAASPAQPAKRKAPTPEAANKISAKQAKTRAVPASTTPTKAVQAPTKAAAAAAMAAPLAPNSSSVAASSEGTGRSTTTAATAATGSSVSRASASPQRYDTTNFLQEMKNLMHNTIERLETARPPAAAGTVEASALQRKYDELLELRETQPEKDLTVALSTIEKLRADVAELKALSGKQANDSSGGAAASYAGAAAVAVAPAVAAATESRAATDSANAAINNAYRRISGIKMSLLGPEDCVDGLEAGTSAVLCTHIYKPTQSAVRCAAVTVLRFDAVASAGGAGLPPVSLASLGHDERAACIVAAAACTKRPFSCPCFFSTLPGRFYGVALLR
jgi:hypothetical protein